MRLFFIFVFLFISSTFSFCSNNCFFYGLLVKIAGDSLFLLYTRTRVDLGLRMTSSGQIVKNKLCLLDFQLKLRLRQFRRISMVSQVRFVTC